MLFYKCISDGDLIFMERNNIMKDKDTWKNLLKKVWVQRLGLVVCGMVLGLIVFNPFAKANVIDKLTIENEELSTDNSVLVEDHNKLKKEYDKLLDVTAVWRDLTEEQKKAALDKVEEDKKIAEAEAKEEAERKAKEEAERLAAEEKAKQEEAQKAVTADLTAEEVKEIIEYNSLSEGDQLLDYSFTNGVIKATVELPPNDMFPAQDLAVNMYSTLSDELLQHEGWEVLTITYANIGTISMNRNEKETNEYGDYFPTLEIEDRLQ
jgi:hypothetical protein